MMRVSEKTRTSPVARVMVEGDDEAQVREYASDLAEKLQRAIAGATG